MGFLGLFKRKARGSEIISALSDAADHEDCTSIAAKYEEVPPDVIHLLWFRDGPLKNIPAEALSKNTVNVGGFSISISFKGAIEPSAIGIGDEIKVPLIVEQVERPKYYPEYGSLSPEQRWVYLNWLKAIDSEVNIGYVFIFYYGLERHLFFGDYEAAFNMILRLRSVHKNRSFSSYSSTAMVLSCILYNRSDMFLKLIDTIDDSHESEVAPLCLLAKRALGLRLKAPEIISLARAVGFSNRRYIDGHRDIFQAHMVNLLERQLNEGSVDLRSYSLDECPIRKIIAAANFSLPQEQRVLDIPDISQHPEFRGTIRNLLQLTHDEVKDGLRNARNFGGAIVTRGQSVRIPAREPDPVFRGGLIFNEMDVHMFDKNIGFYNDSMCPYCGQHLNKTLSRKGKCNACGSTILVRSNVFNGEKMLVTIDECATLDSVAKEGSTRKHIARVILLEKLDIQEIAKRMSQKGIAVERAVLEELAARSDRHRAELHMGFARNSMLQTGQLLERLGRPEQALRYYLAVCYYDLNGADNGPYRFNLQLAFLAPGVLSMISDIAGASELGIDDLREQFLTAAEEHRVDGMPLSPLLAWSSLEGSM